MKLTDVYLSCSCSGKRIFGLHFFILFVVILFAGCTRTIEKDKLQIRGDLAYEVNSDKPFSGKVVDKFKSGQSALEASYTDGKLDGNYISYYSNGQVKCKATYIKGSPDKDYLEYFENGGIKIKKPYSKGVLVGETLEYTDNGTHATGFYINGKLDGLYKIYDSNSQLMQQINYKNGQPTQETRWNTLNHELWYEKIYNATDIQFKFYHNNKVFEVIETYPNHRPMFETLSIYDRSNRKIGDYNNAKHWKVNKWTMMVVEAAGMSESDFMDIVISNN